MPSSPRIPLPDAPVLVNGKRLFYGWIMLPVAMLGVISTSPGQTYGVMAFTEPIRLSLGLTHSQISAAYMLGSLFGAVPITMVGVLMDRYGLRTVMAGCLALFGGACCLAAVASGWFSLLLAFFLLRFLGPGALSLLSGNTLAFWFHRRLGTVEGVRHLGMACAMAAIPAGNLWLVNNLGWRWAYAALGVSVWLVVLPVVFYFFRNRPEDLGQTIDGGFRDAPEEGRQETRTLEEPFSLKETVATSTFWIVLAGTCLYGLIQTGLFFSLIPIVQDRGLHESDAVVLVTAFALSLAAAHLFGGILSDRLPGQFLMSASLAAFSLGLGLFWACGSSLCLLGAGGVLGISQGFYFGASNPSWVRYFGRTHLGRIRGFVMTLMIASSSLGPLLVGLCRDFTGSYDLVLGAFAVAPVPVAAAMLFVKAPCRRRDEVRAPRTEPNCATAPA